jgi:hypothetical protein
MSNSRAFGRLREKLHLYAQTGSRSSDRQRDLLITDLLFTL